MRSNHFTQTILKTHLHECPYTRSHLRHLPPRHDKVRHCTQLHTHTKPRTHAHGTHHHLLELLSSVIRQHFSPITEISKPESVCLWSWWQNRKHRLQGQVSCIRLVIIWPLCSKNLCSHLNQSIYSNVSYFWKLLISSKKIKLCTILLFPPKSSKPTCVCLEISCYFVALA